VECAPIRAQAWLDEHEHVLGALTVEDAVTVIEDAGLQARVLRSSGGWMTQEQHRDRVNLRLTDTGQIAAIDAG
jgi:hypothetical protein